MAKPDKPDPATLKNSRTMDHDFQTDWDLLADVLDCRIPPWWHRRLVARQINVWTLQRMVEVIEREFGVTYCKTNVWLLLKALGFSCHRPT